MFAYLIYGQFRQEATGGEIRVETKENAGAEFVFQLPLKETF